MSNQQPVPATLGFPDSYIIRLLKFRILKTMALHNDTDHISLAVKIGDQDMSPPQIFHTGDVNDGEHLINLSFGPTPIDPATSVTLNYQIVNSGHQNQGEIEKALFMGLISCLRLPSLLAASGR
jgi:hypothetical protein